MAVGRAATSVGERRTGAGPTTVVATTLAATGVAATTTVVATTLAATGVAGIWAAAEAATVRDGEVSTRGELGALTGGGSVAGCSRR